MFYLNKLFGLPTVYNTQAKAKAEEKLAKQLLLLKEVEKHRETVIARLLLYVG